MRKVFTLFLALTLITALTPIVPTADAANSIVTVSDADGAQYGTKILPDSSGFYAIWIDERNGNPDIYAQRFGTNGNALWTEGGVPIATTDNAEGNPQFSPYSNAGNSGIFVAWTSSANNGTIFLQRLTADGEPMWSQPTEMGNDTYTQDQPVLKSFYNSQYGVHGALMIYREHQLISWKIRGVYVNSAGEKKPSRILEVSTEEPTLAQPVYQSASLSFTVYYQVSDRELHRATLSRKTLIRGALAARVQAGKTIEEFFAGHIAQDYLYIVLRDGDETDIRFTSKPGGAYTRKVVNTAGDQSHPRLNGIHHDRQSYTVSSWVDERGVDQDIYALSFFARQYGWGSGGIIITDAPGNQYGQEAITWIGRETFITWIDERDGGPLNADLYAQLLDFEGNAYWEDNGVQITSMSGAKSEIQLHQGADRISVIWTNGTGDKRDIYLTQIVPDDM